MSNAWNQTRQMKILAAGPMMTPGYSWWRSQRVNDNIPVLNQETTRSLEEHLRVMPSELEIFKQDLEKRNLELGKKIEQLEEEKMQLGLDVDIQKLEADKLRKRKNKAEKDLDSLKTDYEKLCLSIRTAGLEKNGANQWERKFQGTRARKDTLKRNLSESQKEKTGLRARIIELENLLHQYCSRNFVIELRASLSKIEELKGKVEELEEALQSCELRVKFFEKNNEHWQEQLHRSQGQIRERDYIIGEAVTQVREVADHLQTLAV
ncbi:hypothetical protein Godav_029328 [Gossypium davidsonii]|uniref:Uncharacterized protein n=1 Tax=Gossypium davidsonii TaxID=34287 RepID=A0A7J8TEQ2_GOSDV|nr:hypothetical protein [Gossypium davidsonii]